MTEHPIILFDGVCNLCTHSVQFIIARDPRAQFRFAALQSPTGQALVEKFNMNAAQVDSMILVHDNKLYVKSDAALEIARHLTGLWRFATVLQIVPRAVRDVFYDWIARYRYQWFGQSQFCLTPTAELQARFLN